jgi:hypothetical protein
MSGWNFAITSEVVAFKIRSFVTGFIPYKIRSMLANKKVAPTTKMRATSKS